MNLVDELLAVNVGSDVMRFFRYVRPQDEHPNNIGHLAAHGGITFYCEYHPEEAVLRFSFAICRDDEAFVRQQGRDETQARYVNGDFYIITDYDDDYWVVNNIMFALSGLLEYDELPDELAHMIFCTSHIDSDVDLEDRKDKQTLELLLGKLLRDAVVHTPIERMVIDAKNAVDKLHAAIMV